MNIFILSWIVQAVILASFVCENKSEPRVKRAYSVHSIQRWPDGVIPYYIDRNAFNEEELLLLQDAINTWNMETCAHLRLKRGGDRNWLKITGGSNCMSIIGMSYYGEQEVNLMSPGCRYYGLYLHELGHAIGLHHEHVHPNRDDHLIIREENMADGHFGAYSKLDKSDVIDFDLQYDLQSIMHYGLKSFSGPGGQPTIELRNAFLSDLVIEVHNKDLSFLDSKVVNLIYNCSDRCHQKVPCPPNGYVDQFCQCHTPSSFGSRRCRDKNEESWCLSQQKEGHCELREAYMAVNCRKTCDKCYKYRSSFLKPTKECKNLEKDSTCEAWAKSGECDLNPGYMQISCKFSCGLCKAPNSSPSPASQCVNIYGDDSCYLWEAVDECQKNKRFMELNCAKACDSCKSKEKNTTNLENDISCVDKYDEKSCKAWADDNQCIKNSTFMNKMCQKSCKLCSKYNSTPSVTLPTSKCKNIKDNLSCYVWSRAGECENNRDFMRIQCKKTCNYCNIFNDVTDSTASSSTNSKPLAKLCKNIYGDSECEKLKTGGECAKNPDFMTLQCSKACGKCQISKITTTSSSCRNRQSDEKCNVWVKSGECYNNPKYMLINCAKSCNKCNEFQDTKPSCKNIYTDSECEKWSKQGECTKNPNYMLINCARSCNSCSQDKETAQTCKNIYTDSECEKWSKQGECTKNPNYMLINCARSCNSCNLNSGCRNLNIDEDCEKWNQEGECAINRKFMMIQCAKTCKRCKTTTYINCKDLSDGISCRKWQTSGECFKNPQFMLSKCARTCGSCDIQNNPVIEEGCVNAFDDKKCDLWKSDGECEKNPAFMLINCAKACGTCIMDSHSFAHKKKCENIYSDESCLKWRAEGKCQKNEVIMSEKCSKTCEKCLLSNNNTNNQALIPRQCKNSYNDDICTKWADGGECIDNPSFMLVQCAASCGQCNETIPETICKNHLNDIECEKLVKANQCIVKPIHMDKMCYKACHNCSTHLISVNDSILCQNVYENDSCDKWSKAGNCTKNKSYMDINCAKSCGVCGNIKPTTSSSVECHNLDADELCDKRTKSGECERNPILMLLQCKKSCGLCTGMQTTKPEPSKCHNLYDNEICEKWMQSGYCQIYPKFMVSHCLKSCGLCKEFVKCKNVYNDNICDKWSGEGECTKNKKFMDKLCLKSCGKCINSSFDVEKTGQISNETCNNKYGDWACEAWKQVGECERNKLFMKDQCAKTCDFCLKATTAASMGPLRMASRCKNTYHDALCEKWVKNGDCQSNSDFMRINCARSCRGCDNLKIRPEKRFECVDLLEKTHCVKMKIGGQCKNPEGNISVNCALTCQKCKLSSNSPMDFKSSPLARNLPGKCINIASDHQCSYWARQDQCERNMPYMRVFCQKACNACNGKQRKSFQCLDKHLALDCQIWTQRGECDRNKKWMAENCAKSCRVCQTSL